MTFVSYLMVIDARREVEMSVTLFDCSFLRSVVGVFRLPMTMTVSMTVLIEKEESQYI